MVHVSWKTTASQRCPGAVALTKHESPPHSSTSLLLFHCLFKLMQFASASGTANTHDAEQALRHPQLNGDQKVRLEHHNSYANDALASFRGGSFGTLPSSTCQTMATALCLHKCLQHPSETTQTIKNDGVLKGHEFLHRSSYVTLCQRQCAVMRFRLGHAMVSKLLISWHMRVPLDALEHWRGFLLEGVLSSSGSGLDDLFSQSGKVREGAAILNVDSRVEDSIRQLDLFQVPPG
eukprot:2730656-Amphidinium_carterae.1